jgi:hypothetical protein
MYKNQIIQFFSYDHLPDHLQDVSKAICLLAEKLDQILPNNPEKSAGMRKLLEAKDCFVRCILYKDNAQN